MLCVCACLCNVFCSRSFGQRPISPHPLRRRCCGLRQPLVLRSLLDRVYEKRVGGRASLCLCIVRIFLFFFPHSRDKLFCLLQAARPAPLVHVSRTGASFPLWVPSPTNCQKPGLRKSYTPVHKKIVYAAEFSFCLYKFLGNEIWQCLRLF